MEKLCLSINEAAETLSVTPRFVHMLIAKGDVKSVRLGRRRLVPREALERLIADRTKEECNAAR